ncbi:TPA: hypothetical protein ACPZ0N_004658, partial [Escherichia coli]
FSAQRESLILLICYNFIKADKRLFFTGLISAQMSSVSSDIFPLPTGKIGEVWETKLFDSLFYQSRTEGVSNNGKAFQKVEK